MKTRKSTTKRLRITRRGKIVRRPMGVNHSRTRKTGGGIRKKRQTLSLNYPMKRHV